jgi:nitroreductase
MAPRHTDSGMHPLFLRRWSPRAFDGTSVPQADLDIMLDAARWAPSAFNIQPWRFVYIHRGDASWNDAVDLLAPFNAAWAKDAGVLVFLASDTLMDTTEATVPSPTHGFDAGAAWAQLAVQATLLGYHVHGMGGFDSARARRLLHVPDRFELQLAIAIGKRGDVEALPPALREREHPSPRRPLGEIAFAETFPGELALAEAA